MKTDEEILKAFYRNLLAAIKAKKKPEWFAPWAGCCFAFERWRQGKPIPGEIVLNQFRSKFLASSYPFGGFEQYEREAETKTIWQNPARLAWVKEHAK